VTETTEPDPQVEWGPSCPVCGNLPDQPDAHWPTCGNASFRRRILWPRPARKPLTVADIPGGQGAASLFLRPDRYGDLFLCRKGADGSVARIPIEKVPALWEHLAATLPTVTREELTRQ
jgi:hypothetical protein